MSALPEAPPRGFDQVEFERRTERLQQAMAQRGLAAAFFTTEPEVRYYSGFLSQFWESPTRPWFLVVPAHGRPIAVVPEIGVAGFTSTWIEDVRTWPSPRPQDDGVSLLADTLAGAAGPGGRIGAMLGAETHLRMPAADFARLGERMGGRTMIDISGPVRELRSIKSAAEVAKIRFACEVTAAGFEHLRTRLHAGMSEREACRCMHREMLRLGADACPYLIAASGSGGYDNIIMGPTDRRLDPGDLLIIDTGARFDGYFSDFDRNYAIGRVDGETRRAYEAVFRATEAGLDMAGPGVTTGELWRSMWSVLQAAGASDNGVGRMGHGLGMQLTEWPSNLPGGEVILRPGMVLTLEPGMCTAPGRMMVHEEDILVTDTGCELLHARAWPELPVVP